MLSHLYIGNADRPDALLLQVCIAFLVVLCVMPVRTVNLYRDTVLRQVEIYRVGMDCVLLFVGHPQRVKCLPDRLLNTRFTLETFLAQARTEARRLFAGAVDSEHLTALVAPYVYRVLLRGVLTCLRAEAGAAFVRELVCKRLPAILTGGLNAGSFARRQTAQRAVHRIAVMPLRLLVKDLAALLTNPLGSRTTGGVVAGVRAKQHARVAGERLAAVLAYPGLWPAWHNKALRCLVSIGVRAILPAKGVAKYTTCTLTKRVSPEHIHYTILGITAPHTALCAYNNPEALTLYPMKAGRGERWEKARVRRLPVIHDLQLEATIA